MLWGFKYRLIWHLDLPLLWCIFAHHQSETIALCGQKSVGCLPYKIFMTYNCWHSVDAYFQNVTERMLQLLLALKGANISLVEVSNQSEHQFAYMESKIWLAPG
jgi:hypothetical protein